MRECYSDPVLCEADRLVFSNVDRLLALFQVMHPETWFEPADSGSGGLWAPAHITVDANWGLQPFWKNEHSFYTSYDVRDTAVFGYAYPETQAWDYASEDSWRRAVTAYVAWTYPMGARSMLTENGAESAGGLSHLLTNSTFTDWSIAITALTKRLPGTFHVEFVFAGISSADADTAVVGQWMQLMPQGTNEDWKSYGAESKTKRFSTLEPTKNGTVSLTMSLIDQVAAGQLASLDVDAVVPYLQGHLGWRVTGVSPCSPCEDGRLTACRRMARPLQTTISTPSFSTLLAPTSASPKMRRRCSSTTMKLRRIRKSWVASVGFRSEIRSVDGRLAVLPDA